MRGIYLAAFKAYHPGYNIDYQDINGKRDIPGDMLTVDLTPYDFVIATPPCNFYSRANYRRYVSSYSLSTRHLLPGILNKLISLCKPFIVENVRNKKMFLDLDLFFLPCFIFTIGRHTYWTNVFFNKAEINYLRSIQKYDFENRDNGTYRIVKNSQGGDNVHCVIEFFLKKVKECNLWNFY